MTIHDQRADSQSGRVFGDQFKDPNPVDHVYAAVICLACPRCKADMGDWCVNPITKRTSRIPCKDRIMLVEFPDDVGIITEDNIPAYEYYDDPYDN